MKFKEYFRNFYEELLTSTSQISSIHVISLIILILPITIGNGPFLNIPYEYIGIFAIFCIFIFESAHIIKHKKHLHSSYLIISILFIASIYFSIFFGINYTGDRFLAEYDITYNNVFIGTSEKIIIYFTLCSLIYFSINILKDLKKIINAFLLSGILINIFSFFLLITNTNRVIARYAGRFCSVYQDPNMLGRFEVFIIIICISFILFGKNNLFKKIILIFNILSCLYIQFLTLSRSAFVTLTITIVLIVILFSDKKYLKYVFLSFVLLVTIFVLSKFATLRMFESNQEASLFGLLDFSNYFRILLNIVGIEMFINKPIFGVGYLNYYNVFLNYSNYYSQFPLIAGEYQIHCWLFSIMAEQGLFGIITFCTLIIMAFKDTYKSIKKSINEEKLYGIIVFSLFFILIFNGLFYWAFFQELIFPVILGILLGYLKIISTTKNIINKQYVNL